jgi:hypothetical protein
VAQRELTAPVDEDQRRDAHHPDRSAISGASAIVGIVGSAIRTLHRTVWRRRIEDPMSIPLVESFNRLQWLVRSIDQPNRSAQVIDAAIRHIDIAAGRQGRSPMRLIQSAYQWLASRAAARCRLVKLLLHLLVEWTGFGSGTACGRGFLLAIFHDSSSEF